MTTSLTPRMQPPTAPPTSAAARRRTPVGLVIVGLLVSFVAALVPMTLPTAVTAQTDDGAAQQAAREIQAARDRANAAADAFFRAQSELELLQDDAERLELEADVLQDRVERLRRDVESLAVARFATSGSGGIPLLTGLQAPKDQVQAEVFVDVVTNAGSSALDEYDLAQKELGSKRDELDDQRADVEQQQVVFTRLQEQAEDEVDRLRRIEEQRLNDEAVQRALAAQQAAALSKLEDAALQQAEAARDATPNPGVIAAQAAAAEAAANAAADDPDADPDDQPTGAAPVGVAPVATVAPNSGASGGTSGGRTGTGGSGSSPVGILTGSGYVDNIVCPMPGSAYGDTWGAPRSGGRRHEGVDMLAPTGIPIYAVVSGVVTFKQNRLGGNAVSLAGDNGNRYYYAHLSRYEGTSRRVTQGEVIGYNGDTGNATGIPHLHFQVHPGGGVAVNPTPSVRAAGC